MKQLISKISLFMGIVCCIAITGCGENKIPEMTEDELQKVGEYAAFTLMKYDAKNRSRLVELDEGIEPEESLIQEMPNPSSVMEPVDNTPITDLSESEKEVRIEEALGLPMGIRVDYEGNLICGEYPLHEDQDIFRLTASQGKQLLVLTFTASNETEEPVYLDLMGNKNVFRITVNGSYTRRVLPTMLLNDFSTIQEELPGRESRDYVLLIEIEEDVEEIETLTLHLKNDANIYTIYLK